MELFMEIFVEIIMIALPVYSLYIFITLIDRRSFNESSDKTLKIKTTGVREWKGEAKKLYHRAESTPYLALKTLIDKYPGDKEGNLVDFGAGRGRAAIFLHSQMDIDVTGVELNELTFKEAQANKESYLKHSLHFSKKKLEFSNIEATQYKIKENDTKFFFFNPFNSSIFEKVIKKIAEDAEENNKPSEIILYYPTKNYKDVMKKFPQFTVKKKITPRGALLLREKFIIYKFKRD